MPIRIKPKITAKIGWRQPEPSDMYQILNKYFISKGQTADIGCGNGRDANWLANQGFKVFGFDSSKELIKIASDQYPDIFI